MYILLVCNILIALWNNFTLYQHKCMNTFSINDLCASTASDNYGTGNVVMLFTNCINEFVIVLHRILVHVVDSLGWFACLYVDLYEFKKVWWTTNGICQCFSITVRGMVIHMPLLCDVALLFNILCTCMLIIIYLNQSWNHVSNQYTFAKQISFLDFLCFLLFGAHV